MDDLNVKTVAEHLLREIGGHLGKYGFEINKSRKYFTRRKINFNQKICFLYRKKAGEVFVEPLVHLESKEIKKFYFKTCSDTSTYLASVSSSIFDLIRYYEDGYIYPVSCQEEYVVRNKNTLNTITKALFEYIPSYAIRYIEENSSISRIDFLLNENPREIIFHYWLYPMRAQIGLIAAKLADRPNLRELIDIYAEEMEDAAEQYKPNFEKIKQAVGQ